MPIVVAKCVRSSVVNEGSRLDRVVVFIGEIGVDRTHVMRKRQLLGARYSFAIGCRAASEEYSA